MSAIIQVFYEVPDDILLGLANGEMSRFGSVVRGAAAITAHLKEVQPPVAEGAGVVQKIAATARNPMVVGVAVGAAAVTVVGGGAYMLIRKREDRIGELTSSLGAYLEAVRLGRLEEQDVNLVLAAIKHLPKFGLPEDRLEPLVREVFLITRQLAKANSRPIPELETSQQRADTIQELRLALEMQRSIFRGVA